MPTIPPEVMKRMGLRAGFACDEDPTITLLARVEELERRQLRRDEADAWNMKHAGTTHREFLESFR